MTRVSRASVNGDSGDGTLILSPASSSTTVVVTFS